MATNPKFDGVREVVLKAMNDGDLLDRLIYLKDRWSCEREYEDFDEYVKNIKEYFAANHPRLIFISMDKRFKTKVRIDNVDAEVRLVTQGKYCSLGAKLFAKN